MEAKLICTVVIEYFNRTTGALSRRQKLNACSLRYQPRYSVIAIQQANKHASDADIVFPLDGAAVIRDSRASEGLFSVQHRDLHFTLLVSSKDVTAVESFTHCLRHKCLPAAQPLQPSSKSNATSRTGAAHAAAGGAGKVGRDDGACSAVLALPALSNEQARVVALVKAGRNVFFTGSAGSGKSLILQHLIALLPPDTTFFTASTGAAAVAVSGVTLHAWAGLTVDHMVSWQQGKTTLHDLAAEILTRRDVAARWRRARVLIVDEISMVDAETLDLIEALARIILEPTMPFGGIQIVMCGDFFQLRPVSKSKEAKYAFQACSWKRIVSYSIQLTTVYRQADESFVKILNEIRWGRCSDETVAALQTRCSDRVAKDEEIVPTKLYTHRADVDSENQAQLMKLPGALREYMSIDKTNGKASAAALLDAAGMGTKKLLLKKSSQVMLIKTINPAKGLVNGARGIVVEFDGLHGWPIVKFRNGQTLVVTPETWQVTCNNVCIASRKQVPLALAWAISIHKSQGMTLDYVEMDLSKVFEYGQTYVALSRAKSLDGLLLKDSFSEACVKAHRDVVTFYQELERAARVDRKDVDLPKPSKRSHDEMASETMRTVDCRKDTGTAFPHADRREYPGSLKTLEPVAISGL